MRAAICYEAGSPLRVEDLAIDEPGPGEVRIRIAACAICHSDIAYIKGLWGPVVPTVFGHEAAGVVEAVGSGTAGLAVGDPVLVTLIRSCGSCRSCGRGLPVLCDGSFRLGGESPLRHPDGRSVAQGLRTGGFAEQVTVHASQVVVLPAEMSLQTASVVACAVLTGYGSVVHTAAVEPGSAVAVIGCGGVGLNAVQAARLNGADPVIAVDVAEPKLKAAERFGATQCVNSTGADPAAAIRAMTGGAGVDYAVVTVGATAAVDLAFAITGTGGAVVLVGMPATGALAAFDPGTIANLNQRVLGSKMGTVRLERDVPAILDLYRTGRWKLDELITGRYPLDAINEAIAAAQAPDSLRTLIVN
ncbi:Zn-dependent alcohol dehydrogenase [Thalassobaculum sp.]|uniref:Zn-dependent alcohol dehydrogenase n=1 Tax=Thalassobaculum sp. TaxID=2022740 RepID=UPI0032EE6D4A